MLVAPPLHPGLTSTAVEVGVCWYGFCQDRRDCAHGPGRAQCSRQPVSSHRRAVHRRAGARVPVGPRLDHRVLLGVGSGGFPDSPFWQAVGLSGRGRGMRMDATLRALPRLLAGEPTELGPQASPVTLAPPVPMPPVLVGGNSLTAMRRAVEFGGWFPSLISPDDLVPAVAELRKLAEERGVPPPSVTVGGHLIVGDDESARSAKHALVRSLIEDHGMPPETAAKVPMTASTASELAEVFAACEAAGADRIVTGPDNGDYRAGLQLMMEARALLD
ncbi:LLM class flavin-dependent oxidoreductase [Spirillospora sp. CA-255316]